MKLPCFRRRHPHLIFWISWPIFAEQ